MTSRWDLAEKGDPAQQASTHLLLDRGEIFRCQRTGLGKVDQPILAGGEHPVDRAAVEVDSSRCAGSEIRALHASFSSSAVVAGRCLSGCSIVVVVIREPRNVYAVRRVR